MERWLQGWHSPGSQSRPAPCALLGRARHSYSHTQFQGTSRVSSPQSTQVAPLPSPVAAVWRRRWPEGHRGAEHSLQGSPPLLRALPLLVTHGPARNLCQPHQALISLGPSLSYGLTAQCNAGNDSKSPNTFSGPEILDITCMFHLNYSLRDKLFFKRG